MLGRVVHPPNAPSIITRDNHPAEKHFSVDDSGFLQVSPETSGFDVAENVFKVAGYVWDVDTLAWVRATQSSGTGGSGLTAAPKKKRFDTVSSTLLYIGEADPGTATSASLWKIKKVIFSGSGDPVSVEYAALGAATAIWDNRAILSYS